MLSCPLNDSWWCPFQWTARMTKKSSETTTIKQRYKFPRVGCFYCWRHDSRSLLQLFVLRHYDRAVAIGGASGPRPPHLKSVTPPFTFGTPVATYIQYCIFKMCPPFWFLAPPAAKSWRRVGITIFLQRSYWGSRFKNVNFFVNRGRPVARI